jgi:general secretion pathway protein C
MLAFPTPSLSFRAPMILLALGLGMAVAWWLPPSRVAPVAPHPPTCRRAPTPAIQQVGVYRYRIARHAFLDLQSARVPGRLTEGGRIVPAVRDGSSIGFRLYGVQAGRLFALLGLRNGDLIKRVNDLDITSPERALGAYQELRRAARVWIDLERRGAPRRLVYDIVD